MKLSNCLWSIDDASIITSSWLKRVEKGVPVFEVDIKVWNVSTGCIETVYNRTDKPVLEGPVANMYLHPECPWILITCCWSGKICFWDLKAQRLLRVYVVNVVFEID